MKKFTILVVLVLAAAMILSACGSSGTQSPTTESSSSAGDATVSQDSSANKNDTSATDVTEEQTANNSTLDNNDIYFIIIDGKKFSAGDKISDLSSIGYELREKEQEQTIAAKATEAGAIVLPGDNISVFYVTVYNPSDASVKGSEAVIGGVTLRAKTLTDEKIKNAEVYGGIKLGSKREEVESAFGEPTKTFDSDTYIYRSAESDRTYKFRFDEDGTVIQIDWDNLVFDK